MGSQKIGRNQPCPCGSGKKYKKCCWAKDQAKNGPSPGGRSRGRAVDRAVPEDSVESGLEATAATLFGIIDAAPNPRAAKRLGRIVVRSLSLLEMGGKEGLFGALTTFGEMLRPGGPLGAIRFPATEFDRVVDEEIAALREERLGDVPREELFSRSMARLGSPAFVAQTRATLERYLRAAAGRDEELGAACAALAVLGTVNWSTPEPAPANPTLEAIFGTQLEDRLAPFANVRERLVAIFAKAQERNSSAEELLREVGALGPELEALDEAAPWLLGGLRQNSEEMTDRAIDIVTGPEPPPIFTLDELLLLLVPLRACAARFEDADPEDDAVSAARTEELYERVVPVLEEIAPGIADRMFAELNDGDLPRKERERLGPVHSAFRLDPELVGLRALMNGKLQVWVRFDEELPFIQAELKGDGEADLAGYADCLDQHGEGVAAQRVRGILAQRRS